MSEFLPGEIGQDPEPNEPKPVALDALHRRLGGRMVAFAGFSLPLHYKPGIMAEHRHCREHAALFDVSHMGQVVVEGPAAAAAEALERLVPADLAGLASGRQVYTALLDEAGGILDDLIVARLGDRLFLVVNAARRSPDLAHLTERLPERLRPRLLEDRALLALQGPGAAAVMQGLAPETAALPFMSIAEMSLGGITARVSRSGYTGEDGFEISVAADQAEALATRLLGEPGVLPAGLGARDSLRLEAGLPLYGQDIDEL
ncbi:MAG TPA: glycine cleavage system protein T, partial [Acetobacteraceae bacterium]|nr:glycine cleavage system protein T [Acetobacteraceae bacterium]